MKTYEVLDSLWGTIPEDTRNITFVGFAAVVIVSIVIALLIAHMYNRFFDANTTGSKIHRSFPILAPAVTTIFITVQYSLPLSLGLLGALSIVRFRTPIKEPEEIGFILLVIATSISISTFNIAFATTLYIIVYACLFIRSKLSGSYGLQADTRSSLSIIIDKKSNSDDITKISDSLKNANINHKVVSVQISDRGTSATIVTTKNRELNLSFLDYLKTEFPEASFDFYQQ